MQPPGIIPLTDRVPLPQSDPDAEAATLKEWTAVLEYEAKVRQSITDLLKTQLLYEIQQKTELLRNLNGSKSTRSEGWIWARKSGIEANMSAT